MKHPIKSFLIMYSFFVLASGMLGPIYALFVSDIGGDILTAGLAWSIFMLVSGIGILLMGFVHDKIKRDKQGIIIGYAIITVGTLGYVFVSKPAHLFYTQVILGLGTMISIPASDSYYTKYLESGKFASQWAAWEALHFIVVGVAALIGSFLAKFYGFKTLFLVMFFIALAGLFISFKLPEA